MLYYCLPLVFCRREKLKIACKPENAIQAPVNDIFVYTVPEDSGRHAFLNYFHGTAEVRQAADTTLQKRVMVLLNIYKESRTHASEVVTREFKQTEKGLDYVL